MDKIRNVTRPIANISKSSNAIHPLLPLFLDSSAAELAVGGGLVPAQEPGGRLRLHQENLPGTDIPRRHGIPPPDSVLKVKLVLLFNSQIA